MKMSFGLEINQSQKMILTKELKQSLEILQMNRFEIEELIVRETNENPTLEVEKKDEIDWEKYLKNLRDSSYKVYSNFFEIPDDEDSNAENYLKNNVNMYDYLSQQLRLMSLDSKVFAAGCYIIRTLNKDGYFKEDIRNACRNVGVAEEVFAEALEVVQSLEPSGIAARNISECLLLQIKDKGISDKVLENIIIEDIEMVGAHKYKELCKKYSIPSERLKAYIDYIKTLDPRPARQLASDENQYVLPDVVVERKSHGFEVRLNNDSLPSLKISSFYEKMLKDSIEKETKDYIKEKLQSSLMLIKNIEQRKNTVLKVAKGIVEEQEEFFLYGKNHIKPMILRDIAEKTGFHEPTISRTVNGKYMLTPKGLFEFKYFFSSGVKDCDGDMVSNINIKNELKDIIDKENKKKPLSDQKICDILNLKGINISRRTVAKYREELNIPGSSIRKEI